MPPPRTGPAPRAAPRANSRKPRGPSLWTLLLPFAMFAAASLVAALHRLLGEPLGPGATAKLAEMWSTMAMLVVVYAPVLAHYKKNSEAIGQDKPARAVTSSGSHTALRVANKPTQRKEEPSDHDDDGSQQHNTGPR